MQCCSAPSSVEVVDRLLCKLQEMTISEDTFLMLLCEVKESSSDLLQLLQALKDARGMNPLATIPNLFQIPLSNTSDDISLSDDSTEDSSGMDLLRIYQNRLTELNLDHQLIEQSLKMGPDMNENEREVPVLHY